MKSFEKLILVIIISLVAKGHTESDDFEPNELIKVGENIHAATSIFIILSFDTNFSLRGCVCVSGGLFDDLWADSEPETGKSLPEIVFDYSVKHVNKERHRRLPKMKAGE